MSEFDDSESTDYEYHRCRLLGPKCFDDRDVRRRAVARRAGGWRPRHRRWGTIRKTLEAWILTATDRVVVATVGIVAVAVLLLASAASVALLGAGFQLVTETPTVVTALIVWAGLAAWRRVRRRLGAREGQVGGPDPMGPIDRRVSYPGRPAESASGSHRDGGGTGSGISSGSHPEGGAPRDSGDGSQREGGPPPDFGEEAPYPVGPDYTEPVWDAEARLWRLEQWVGKERRWLWSHELGDLWHGSVEEARAYRDREGA